MKGISQLLIAVRLLSTINKFSGQLSLFFESGRVYLYCIGEQVVYVELGDLFPASWLAQTNMGATAAKIRDAKTTQEKITAFQELTQNPELKNLFVQFVKKHLSEFFLSNLRKCELKADPIQNAEQLFSLSDMFAECARDLTSSFTFEELLPANDVSFQLSADYLERSTRIKISLQQGYLLSRLERPHTVQNILPTIPAGEEATKRNLLVLWAFGILDSNFLTRMLPSIQTTPQTSAANPSSRVQLIDRIPEELQKQIEMIEQTYSSLGHKDYYNLLGVTTKADMPQIKTAYYKLARKFHPDRYYGLEDPIIKEKIDIIFSTINVAYETLKNSKSRHQYDSSPLHDRRINVSTSPTETFQASPESVAKVAEDYYQRAQKAYSSRNFFEAVQFLRSATQISPTVAKYWRQLGIALSKNDQWRKEAEDSFQRAVDLEPQNPENHLYLAFLYRNSDLKLRAKRCFLKVLELDPKNEVARAQVAEIDAGDSGSTKKGILDSLWKKK
jgi:curved DNA-binding protein CbpA